MSFSDKMDGLIIDLTHGGLKIAIELRKLEKYNNIWAYDIYNTLNDSQKNLLNIYDIKLIDESSIATLKSKNLIVVNPIHSPFKIDSILENPSNIGYHEITHHEAVKEILKNWEEIVYIKSQKKNSNNKDNKVNKNNRDNEGNSKDNKVNKNNKDEKNNENKENKEKNENSKNKNEKTANNEKNIDNKIPIIEVTGVKGKTSIVSMLKDILMEKNPLVLSSLGASIYKNNKEIILRKDISITPASILETVKLARKINNSDCKRGNDFSAINNEKDLNSTKNNLDLNYMACIFENSLGISGIGDLGILTNIVENYPIAKNSKRAKDGKKQVFNSNIVITDLETLSKYYQKEYDLYKDKINVFHLDDNLKINPEKQDIENTSTHNSKIVLLKIVPNLIANNVEYGLEETSIKISYNDIKTIYGNTVSGSFNIKTFAPGKHHVLNVLCAVSSSLTLEIDEKIIKEKLSNFEGIKGRTSQKITKGIRIIEEINPGINVKAIEYSINMIDDLNNYYIIIGGKYGITCEEIDEKKVANLVDNLINSYSNDNKINILFTDELGKGIKRHVQNEIKYINDPFKAQKIAINNNKNILFIYRSNYSQLNKR